MAYCEPCYCNQCDGTQKFFGEPCYRCGDLRWGCRSMSCLCVPVEHLCICGQERTDLSQQLCLDCWLADLRQKYRGASRFQALWRGYTERKKLREQNACELSIVEPAWRKYDEQYKMYVLCQTIVVELMKDDADWDPTQTPYYIWMMENGPLIDEYEGWMHLRGWKRPKTKFNIHLFTQLAHDVFLACGETTLTPRVIEIITDTLIKLR